MPGGGCWAQGSCSSDATVSGKRSTEDAVGGDDTEATLKQSGFGVWACSEARGCCKKREGGSGGSSSWRRWSVKRREGKQCPGTVHQRQRASSPRPVLVGSRLQDLGWGGMYGLRH